MNPRLSSYSFSFISECPHQEVRLFRGRYLIEGWGASGGGGIEYSGKGAYLRGTLYLPSTTKLYVTIGGVGETSVSGENQTYNGGCNGGGRGGLGYGTFSSGSGGGGSTDIRILTTSLSSRIFVAAGGGGSCGQQKFGFIGKGGYGGNETGGLAPNGLSSEYNIAATLNDGFDLGQGQDGKTKTKDESGGGEGNGGGGSGYYGGYSPQVISDSGGHGGSSFINSSFFHTYQMFSGNMLFNSPNGTLEEGHYGNGFLHIVLINNATCNIIFPSHLLSTLFFTLICSYK